MMDIAIHIDMPALDRLVNYLEERAKTGGPLPLMEKREIARPETPQPPMAAAPLKGAPEPEPEPEPETPQPPMAAAPLKGAPEPKPEPKATTYTLDQVQRAAAMMRDQGKLSAVTDMFGEFKIRKLSDLTGDALQDFAGRLIRLGAKL